LRSSSMSIQQHPDPDDPHHLAPDDPHHR
jgi:hypothetical protein